MSDRSGPDELWIHEIATFAGHRNTDITLQYIHLSRQDLADKLARGIEHIHA